MDSSDAYITLWKLARRLGKVMKEEIKIRKTSGMRIALTMKRLPHQNFRLGFAENRLRSIISF